jgi:hypothetical protein
VEIDLVQRKIHGMGDAKFSPRDDVESQALFLKYKSYRSVQEGFRGINDQCIRIIFTELIFKFTTLMAEGGFIEKIERRAEFLSQVNHTTAADKEMSSLIHLSS